MRSKCVRFEIKNEKVLVVCERVKQNHGTSAQICKVPESRGARSASKGNGEKNGETKM